MGFSHLIRCISYSQKREGKKKLEEKRRENHDSLTVSTCSRTSSPIVPTSLAPTSCFTCSALSEGFSVIQKEENTSLATRKRLGKVKTQFTLYYYNTYCQVGKKNHAMLFNIKIVAVMDQNRDWVHRLGAETQHRLGAHSYNSSAYQRWMILIIDATAT